MYNKGYNIIIIGDKSHPEVQGINGWCDNKAIIGKNLEEFYLIDFNIVSAIALAKAGATAFPICLYLSSNGPSKIQSLGKLCN